jgi:hypothetical protein
VQALGGPDEVAGGNHGEKGAGELIGDDISFVKWERDAHLKPQGAADRY